MTQADHKPHQIDLIIGANLRRIRLLRGLSQEALASKLGLTFQQLQKYEKGINRVSACKLWELSILLDAPLEDLFLGAEGAKSLNGGTPKKGRLLDLRKDEIDLIRLLRELPPSVTARFRDLLKATAKPKRAAERPADLT